MKKSVIIRVITAVLKIQNGYTQEEIDEQNMAEDSEGSELWNELEKIKC